MAHSLVVGVTGSGKSRLAREVIVPGWMRRGYAVFVLDPVGQPWPCTWQTKDPYRFLEAAQRSQKVVLIIDECGIVLRGNPQQERDLQYLAVQSRNDGHVAYFLAQRTMMVPPNYRNQCERVYAFRQCAEDAEDLAELLNQPALLEAPSLPKGVCIEASAWENPRKLRVF